MRFVLSLIAVAFFITGCAVLDMTNEALSNLNHSLGTSAGPTLGARPDPGSCTTTDCQRIDAIEAEGYRRARAGTITWVRFVNAFYSERAKLFSPSLDGSRERELISFHRALAEHRDAGKISEAQWEYLIDKKYNDLNARDAVISNTQPKTRNCTTTKSGLDYKTTCQ